MLEVPAFICKLRATVSSNPVAVKMSYIDRLDPKIEMLLQYFRQPSAELEPLFQAILYNTSIKPNHIENALKFLQSLNDVESRAARSVFSFLWPVADPESERVGLSEDKAGRSALMQTLLSRVDLVRRFVKAAPVAAWDVKGLQRLAKTLHVSPDEAVRLITLRPRILRGLVKPPRPAHAAIASTVLVLPIVYGLALVVPRLAALGLYLIVVVGVGGLTAWLSMKCAITPGVLCDAKTRRRIRQVLDGDWQPSGAARRMADLGIKVEEFLRPQRYEEHGVRVEIRDKRTVEGAMQFLTSSEEIGNCIALRNFVSWTLPALLNDESVVLADVSFKGSGTWQQRAQLWMIAAQREGRPVLTVNSVEFNNEGARYFDTLLPAMVSALQDVAVRAGFTAIYVGISDFGRHWFDTHYPQGPTGAPIVKLHSSELGSEYYFDAYRWRGSRFEFMQHRTFTACAYAVAFGLLEMLQGNQAKAQAFLDAARNRHNCWEVPLQQAR